MIKFTLSTIAIAAMTACATAAPAGTTDITDRLLPVPDSVATQTGELTLTQSAAISIDPACAAVGRHFAERLRRGTGWTVAEEADGVIRLEVAPDSGEDPEAYALQVTPERVVVKGVSADAVARGLETLLQLMPPAIYGPGKLDAITLPSVTIRDAPQYAWRAAMLDVARKHRDREDILKLLDGLASCKLNVFHWHLTDDEGWRLPVAGYPKLTENRPAYTRDDIRAVVARAAELGIMIVPEIDMPGHSSASCRAYPSISTPNDKGKPTGTMNPGADASYQFIDAVFKDVGAQFPNSPYIHIGADEVGSRGWKTDPQCLALMQKEKLNGTHELFQHFIKRAVALAKKHGKRCIAWDEAFDAKHNDPSLIIMSWRGMKPGIAAANAGFDVVQAPNGALYVNHANSRSFRNPRAFSAGPAYLSPIYHFTPIPKSVAEGKRSRVWGGEVCLWGEYVEKNTPPMFPMMFPRACALGENLWMPRERLDWNSYLKRQAFHLKRLDAMEIPYFWEPETLAVTVGTWGPGDIGAQKGVLDFPLDGKLRYAGFQEFFITQTTGEGQFRVESIELLKDGAVVDSDKGACDSGVYAANKYLYAVTNPDIAGRYTLRIKATQLFGECSGIVQTHSALAPDQYSKQCDPKLYKRK